MSATIAVKGGFGCAKKAVGKVCSDFPAHQLELTDTYFELKIPQDQSCRQITYSMERVWEEGHS